jgi:hypothetical protein
MRRGNFEAGPRIKPVNQAEFTIAAHTPRRAKIGRPRKLTPTQVAELAAWDKAVRALGTNKTKAAELGVSTTTVVLYLREIRNGGRDTP